MDWATYLPAMNVFGTVQRLGKLQATAAAAKCLHQHVPRTLPKRAV